MEYVVAQGFLIKEPVHKGLFAKWHTRLFKLTRTSLEWYESQTRQQRLGMIDLFGASLEVGKGGTEIVIVSTGGDRLVLRVAKGGQQVDLDEWADVLTRQIAHRTSKTLVRNSSHMMTSSI